MRAKPIVLGVLLAIAVIAWFALDLGRFLTLEKLHEHQEWLVQQKNASPLLFGAAFFAVYVLIAGASIPGATVLTLAAGSVFGLLWGIVLVSFASALGATIAFIVARYVLRDFVRRRFEKQSAAVDAGIRKDGIFYLLALRLVPIFPFFLINLAMGLTAIPVTTFYWVSQLGMLPGTIVYVNAGTQLSQVRTLADVASPMLLGSFALLGIFPLLAKFALDRIKARKVYRRWIKPRRFDRNLIVIGGGAAGLVAAYVGAIAKAKVTLVEGRRMGGDCLNFGCVPSKALIRAANLLHQARRASAVGLRDTQVEFDFGEVMARIRRVIATIAPHDSVERYTALGAEVLLGHARIVSPWSVEISNAGATRTLATRAIVIAAGSSPVVPPIPGLSAARCLTSDTIWDISSLPERLVVLGGGPIGCELAQALARFGATVTVVEMAERILLREDPDVAAAVTAALERDGVRLLTAHKATRVEHGEHASSIIVEGSGQEKRIECDAILCAVGRVPHVTGFGLEELGIPLRDNRTIETDAYLQTLYPNIYACGDVAGPFQFTHTAAQQAGYAATNALLDGLWHIRMDDSVIPWATFTDPEVAHVGVNETEATQKKTPFEITRYALGELDRAIVDDTTSGFIKILTPPDQDRILGVTIVGEHAADLLVEFVLAMKHGIGLKGIFAAVHTYPTLAEANKYAAGNWRKRHAPACALTLAERYLAWRRGS
ncbi:MAG: pyridine nucleotide-disulfide oxidoreductase [Betaproteobacteria bacterium 13_1_40CM_4_64_4]|nr:MAG: pyridine nucleotide-disulfide oxidoreductase [Betaproteobacteria bacterium 13_1_40CM_4_64_4]